MRRLGIFVLAVLAVILQASFLPALRPFGVVPNVALVTVVLISLRVATSEAVIAAAACGLVLDLSSGSNFGLWTGVLTLTALAVGLMHRGGIELDRLFVPMAIVIAGTLVLTAVIWLALIPSVSHWPAPTLAGQLAVELMINLVLTMVLRPVTRFLLSGGGPQTERGG